jgi:hypothetical protein
MREINISFEKDKAKVKRDSPISRFNNTNLIQKTWVWNPCYLCQWWVGMRYKYPWEINNRKDKWNKK